MFKKLFRKNEKPLTFDEAFAPTNDISVALNAASLIFAISSLKMFLPYKNIKSRFSNESLLTSANVRLNRYKRRYQTYLNELNKIEKHSNIFTSNYLIQIKLKLDDSDNKLFLALSDIEDLKNKDKQLQNEKIIKAQEKRERKALKKKN